MGLETGTYVQDLVATNPIGGDQKAQGDDHIRLIKSLLRNTFPDATRPMYRAKGATNTTGDVAVTRAMASTFFSANTTGGNVTYDLPQDLDADDAGWYITVQKTVAANSLVIDAGAELINGIAIATITSQYTTARVYWDGSAFKAFYTFGQNTAGADPLTTLRNSLIPAGLTFIDWSTTIPDGGFIYLYGALLVRASYPALFARWGTTYGAGDGSTTFGSPDTRGRVVASQDDIGGTSANRLTGTISGIDGDVIGAAGGVEHLALSIAQMPAHTHGGVHTGGAITDDQTDDGSRYNFTSPPDLDDTTESTGGGLAHTNMQPTIIGNFVAKAH